MYQHYDIKLDTNVDREPQRAMIAVISFYLFPFLFVFRSA